MVFKSVAHTVHTQCTYSTVWFLLYLVIKCVSLTGTVVRDLAKCISCTWGQGGAAVIDLFSFILLIHPIQGDQYWRLDENMVVEPGFPKPLASEFPGLTGTISAALAVPATRSTLETVYFFRNGEEDR